MSAASATDTSLEQLREQVEIQRRIVAEAEQVYNRAVEWDEQQNTSLSAAGLSDARRDLAFYRGALRRLEARLTEAEAAGGAK